MSKLKTSYKKDALSAQKVDEPLKSKIYEEFEGVEPGNNEESNSDTARNLLGVALPVIDLGDCLTVR